MSKKLLSFGLLGKMYGQEYCIDHFITRKSNLKCGLNVLAIQYAIEAASTFAAFSIFYFHF